MKKQYFKIELAPVDMDGLNEIYTNPNLHLLPGSAITVTEDAPPKKKKPRGPYKKIGTAERYFLHDNAMQRATPGQHTAVVAILRATSQSTWTRAAIRTLVAGRIPDSSISSVVTAMIKKGVLRPVKEAE